MEKSAPSISHLLFVDDCFLFFKATSNESATMKAILNTYEAASGQAINLAKFEIFYSRNFPEEIRVNITLSLGVAECQGPNRYLGCLP